MSRDKSKLIVRVLEMSIVCEWATNTPHKPSLQWVHPACDIHVVKGVGVKSTQGKHAQISHAIQIALQDAHLRVSQLRYLAHGGGIQAKHKYKAQDDLLDTKLALWGEDEDTEHDHNR